MLSVPFTLWIARAAIREAQGQRQDARLAHEAQMLEQRRAAEEAAEAHRERMAQELRATAEAAAAHAQAAAGPAKLQRVAQMQRLVDILVGIGDAVRVQLATEPSRDLPGSRIRSLLTQLRVANAVLRVLGETRLSGLKILSENAVGMNLYTLEGESVEALRSIELYAATEEKAAPVFQR